jgi:hypothetical protein
MATTNIRHLWHAKVPSPVGETKSLMPLYDLGKGSTLTLPATTGDILQIVTMPGRLQIGGSWKIFSGDHDTGSNLVVTLRLWDGTTGYPLIYQTAVCQAGGVAIPSLGPVTETGIGKVTAGKLWELQLLIDVGAAGGAQAAKLFIQAHYNGVYPSGIIAE